VRHDSISFPCRPACIRLSGEIKGKTKKTTVDTAADPLNFSLASSIGERLIFSIMIPLQRWLSILLICLPYYVSVSASDANRLVYLDETDPFYVHGNFPKLITPQWIGEQEVDAVVILAIDDMRDPARYEAYLRPILERLKQIDGRAPVSIMANALDPANPLLQTWIGEGLSLEVHTLTHPCPLLAGGNFAAAANTFHGCVDLLHQIPGNKPVAYRMPCCDSMNSPSPRFYAEIFNRTNISGQFLTIDSSVMNITTPRDLSLPRELVLDPGGTEKFRKYLPFPSFVTTIENYPYPYVIGKLCWEMPGMVPSDWEAQNIHGVNHPGTVADLKIALDVTVLKQGVFNLIFHPHGWIRNDQMIELIDYAVDQYGPRVRFLNFREAQELLDLHLLLERPLRGVDGQDNGVRLIDLNHDGFLDVISSDDNFGFTRVWDPVRKEWNEFSFPEPLLAVDENGARREMGIRFGVVHPDGRPSFLHRSETRAGAWHFDGERWTPDEALLNGLELNGRPVLTTRNGRDQGVRWRDINMNGKCELIASHPEQQAIFEWSSEEKRWIPLPYSLPEGVFLVDAEGRDNGVRFVDLNDDGYADLVHSNPEGYGVYLFTPEPKPHLAWERGWTQKVRAGDRADPKAIPMIVRNGPNRNNGVWFHSGHMWVQNEDTAHLPDKVDRRSFEVLIAWDAPEPKSPEESLRSLQVAPGFVVELVAHEPLVMDPISFEWGEDGRLWVVEMGDYPTGIGEEGKPGGIVRVLEDSNGDGVYDQSTVFLDGLNFPTGVMPWRNGALISAAPEIFYAEDSTGDGKADLRRVLFTGFVEGNQQHRVNGFSYGLDNWIYGANGDSGGRITSVLTGETVSIQGRDFRFHPDTGEFETVAGQSQFGRYRDDWGNWFGNNNPNWVWHYHLPEEYLRRNPHLAVRGTKKFLADYPDATRVYRISAPMQRFNWPGMTHTLTSANSPSPYRDELLGPEFTSSIFISEPENNLVHRGVLTPDEISFTSRRAPGEEEREFLASSDNWFRPTMTKTGPDGALYIADMYRLVIEHIEYAMPGMEKQIDLRAGEDRGRIYRLWPEGTSRRELLRLDRLDTAGLVAALESPNGWRRDTAQRLLVQARDQRAARPLEELVKQSPRPVTRMQAAWTLSGLQALRWETLLGMLEDPHPGVREHAVRLAEPFLQGKAALSPAEKLAENEIHSALLKRLRERVEPETEIGEEALIRTDPDIRVRYQTAFTLGEWNDPRAGDLLAQLALRDGAHPDMQTAILSSALPHLSRLMESLLAPESAEHLPVSFVEQLAGMAVLQQDHAALLPALDRAVMRQKEENPMLSLAVLAGFLDALDRRNSSIEQYQRGAPEKLKQALSKLDPVFAQARQDALDPEVPERVRLGSIRLLGRSGSEREEDWNVLAKLLRPQMPSNWQRAALAQLGRLREESVAPKLLSGWQHYSPAIRSEVLEKITSRPDWIRFLLQAIESGMVPPNQVPAAAQQKLLAHSQAQIRERAGRVFVQSGSDRKQVVEEYARAGKLPGVAERGREIFREHCASCHRLGEEGLHLGPDLSSFSRQSTELLLTAILDPNQAVEAPYVNYTVLTRNGREFSGIISAETPNNITLRLTGGFEEVILRSEIVELTSSGLSMMPEGYENFLSPQDLADLFAWMRME
jgi:putative membrane-bound dehydrogenase-like protein